jgi:uncharacterized membrane protein
MDQQIGTNPDITSDDKLWALLAYIFSPIIPIVILLMEDKKNRPFLKAHNVQALAWGLIYIILGTALSFIVVGFCIYPIGWILAIYWGIQAYNGKYVNIPVITDFVKKQGWA